VVEYGYSQVGLALKKVLIAARSASLVRISTSPLHFLEVGQRWGLQFHTKSCADARLTVRRMTSHVAAPLSYKKQHELRRTSDLCAAPTQEILS
jgi:hypothetical protein